MLFNFILIFRVGFISVLIMSASAAYAVGFGEPDSNRHPGMGSVRYIFNNLDARMSCSGSLIYKDSQKYVILTAAHCSQPQLDGWNSVPPGQGSVGVSFDEINLPNDTDPSDGGADGIYYVSGGTSIEHPLYRFPGNTGFNDKYDIDIVIIPVHATNSVGQTIAQRWGNVPINAVAPLNFSNALIDNKFANQTLLYVGFGTQPTKNPVGSGLGNKDKLDENGSFPNRKLAYVGYKNANGAMINISNNGSVVI